MTEKLIKKKEKRLQEIKAVLDKEHNSSLLDELNEIQFDLNKRYINFVLRDSRTKYYYANQCAEFVESLLKYGFQGHKNITPKEVAEKGVSFNEYSINLGSSKYDTVIYRFNSKEEMLGFVIGYNEALRYKFKSLVDLFKETINGGMKQ